ncbi:MAG: LAGLIDADG family homing endonuclease [Solirubrobacteraceae bacterium]
MRHLWATDGCIWAAERPDGRAICSVYYTTSSPRLAEDVALLLLRLQIVARIKMRPSRGDYVPSYHVLL